MPYALVLPLKPLNAAPVPAAVCDCVHAAFFALIDGVDPALAARLHGLEERKPFTLCPLYEEGRGRGGRVPVLSGLRLTLLDERLFGTVAHALMQGAELRVGDALFAVTDILAIPDAHPLAGRVTYGELWERGDCPDTLTVHFGTPTVFRSQKRDVLWPEPRLAWQSWARAWQAFAPVEAALPDEAQMQEWTAGVVVTRHQLHTQTLPMGNGGQAGFTGVCAYNVSALEASARRILTLLAEFAFYAGTGHKTAMGMGQTRCKG